MEAKALTMNPLLSFLCFVFMAALSQICAGEISFVALDGTTDKVLFEHGQRCNQRYSPCSTFKIALSLIGFDLGILQDEQNPEMPYEGYSVKVDSWKCSQTPTTWMQRSVVWYSQVLTQRIGLSRMGNYIALFGYGNQDLSGDRGENNGLTHAWLSSSLKISAIEQTAFLQKLLTGRLPVSPHAQQMTKNLLFCDTLEQGWKLYGKTGTGFERYHDGSPDFTRQIAWFVGWIEKNDHKFIFALNISELQDVPTKDERTGIVVKHFKEAGILTNKTSPLEK